jgi:AAA15 family ATPase/GTPase
LLISLFNSNKNNPYNAQLLFTSHDMNLIDKSLLRRDQIIICDKSNNGSSTYAKLSAFNGLSKVGNLVDWYLDGRFGGIPIVDDLELKF